MKKMKRLLVDLSSLSWRALLAGKDEEFAQTVEHDGKVITINGWQHGYENAIESLLSAWRNNGIEPIHTILVRETGNSKGLRKRFLPAYKAGRDAHRPQQAFTEFHTLQEKLIEAVTSIGGSVVTRPNLEADDVIAYLAGKLDGEKLIMTSDRDLAVLINEETSLWYENDRMTQNPYWPGPVSWIPVYKALVGDASDKIPGAKGFGDKAWLDLLAIFGAEGIQVMEDLIQNRQLDRLAEDVPEMKALQRIIDSQDQVYASYAAGLLYPQGCENMLVPLQWKPGYVKPRAEITDERLKPYGGTVTLVHGAAYDEVYERVASVIGDSPFVALDIETSMPDEAIAWLQQVKNTESEDKLGVDVLGSELNGLALTFGANNQHTVYMSCGHLETEGERNLTSEQIRRMVALIPDDVPVAIHNTSFELPILYLEWGAKQADNGWHGFIPNAHDTRIMANYVNENISAGLKECSQHYLGYTQTTYGEVTQGRRMNQMTAREVLDYGADDTIMTAALYNHFRMICEIEGSWRVFLDVEVKPAYLTALAFAQGTPISLERMLEMEREDLAEAARLQQIINQFLISKGWDGTVCPTYTADDLQSPARVKEIYRIIVGEELKTMVRTPDKLYKLIAAQDHEDAQLLGRYLDEGNINQINDWVATRFTGEPDLNLGSPKQMKHLLYEVLGLEVKVINALTDNERATKRDLAEVCANFNKIQSGAKSAQSLTEAQKTLLIQKASTDDTAIAFALLDDLDTEVRTFLESLMALKKIQTRCNLFYNKYRTIQHWKTGRVHASMNQCATVTRRYSSSGPNLQQLPKKGEGAKFRQIFVPHKPDAVICSIDFSGQELRLGADLSKDAGMLACYVGEHKRDMHSITAAGAMQAKWGKEKVQALADKYGIQPDTSDAAYDLFIAIRHSEDREDAKLAEDLRKIAKNVNFGAQYDSQAPTLAKTIVIPIEDAQKFLDAKHAMFPRFEKWKDEVKTQLHRDGYVTTVLGARRHLTDQILSDNKWEVAKAERQGPNMAIQGSSAEMLKRSMSALWDSGALFRYDARFIAPIHDELVTSVAIEDAAEFIKIKHQCMTIKYMQEVPEVGSISVGPNFGIQHECGDDYNHDAIMKALGKSRETVTT